MVEFDELSLGLSLLFVLVVAIFFFRDPAGVGMDSYPLVFKVVILVFSLPLFYIITFWQLNQ